METALIIVGLLAVVGVGAAGVLLVGRAKLSARVSAAEAREQATAQAAEQSVAALKEQLADERASRDEAARRAVELSNELSGAREKLASIESLKQQLEKNEARLREAFESLSSAALKGNREEFLAQAKPVFDAAKKEQAELVKPISEVLGQTREKLEQIEKSRVESFARLMEQVEHVTGASVALKDETARLSKALSRPEIRGQYGEIQLRRVAELAGMTSYCDFSEQTSTRDDEGRLHRPDMVVRLPNERVIAVDAKTNTYAYLEAVNAGDEQQRIEHLDRFARHVADQAKKLADKKYWSAWEGSPEFVVMFVPGDHFIDAALQRRPDLIEFAAQHSVILASPSTLIGLLRAVAVGWREHKLAEEANELFELGRELHDRAATAFEHAASLGSSIRQAVERYNKLVGSIDLRLVPTLKRFEEAGAASAKELKQLPEVTVTTRSIEAAQDGEA